MNNAHLQVHAHAHAPAPAQAPVNPHLPANVHAPAQAQAQALVPASAEALEAQQIQILGQPSDLFEVEGANLEGKALELLDSLPIEKLFTTETDNNSVQKSENQTNKTNNTKSKSRIRMAHSNATDSHLMTAITAITLFSCFCANPASILSILILGSMQIGTAAAIDTILNSTNINRSPANTSGITPETLQEDMETAIRKAKNTKTIPPDLKQLVKDTSAEAVNRNIDAQSLMDVDTDSVNSLLDLMNESTC